MAFSNNSNDFLYPEDQAFPESYGPTPGEYEGGWSGYGQTPSGGEGLTQGQLSNAPLPYGNSPTYPVTTGIYGTQPTPATYGAKPPGTPSGWSKGGGFPTPSGAGAGKVPGQTWGAGGPTGQFMTAPTMGPMPSFVLPTWDESAIESKAQKAAGPGLRELRKGMREAQGRYYENPNVRRMTLRDAMAGYGMGLEKVMGGARRQAVGEYAAEYAPQVTKAQAEYTAQLQSTMSQYQSAWTEYLARMTAG